MHYDFRPGNLIRAPANSLPCKTHNCVHKWNIIDFPWVQVDDVGDVNTRLVKKEYVYTTQRRSFRCMYFYTGSSY